MEPLDEHLASINNTILSSTLLMQASFVSCVETRQVIRRQREAVGKMRLAISRMANSNPFNRFERA